MLLNGEKAENTLYFVFSAAPTEAELLALGTAIASWWGTHMAPLTPSTTILREVTCSDLSDAEGPQVTFVPATEVLGTMSTSASPNNVSLTVSFRTAMRGRSRRGRNYIAGLGISQIVGNNVVSGYADAFVTAYLALLPVAEALSCVWSVASRFSGVNPATGKPIPRTTGVTTPIITAVIVDFVVDSQRRRLPGRGT
jgi:hypothetical protein